MPRDKRDIESALTGKGFTRREGDPHDFVYMAHQGQQSRAHTKTSHTPNRKEISDGLLGHKAKPFGLTKPEFLDRVDYPFEPRGFRNPAGRVLQAMSRLIHCWSVSAHGRV